jgi:hypothetical protein
MMSINDTIGCVNHDCAKCKAQSASNQELTKQEFGGDCDTPPEPWSAIWAAWNSEDGFTFWNNEKQAALWSAADSNEWPVQYAMQKAPPAPVQEPRARLLKFIGKDTYLEQGYTIARTYKELPKDSHPGVWEEGEKLYTAPPAAPEKGQP